MVLASLFGVEKCLVHFAKSYSDNCGASKGHVLLSRKKFDCDVWLAVNPRG
jgi:hypothetical protein